ncbi:MAG: response regulator [Candidatus Thermoplasmatota archaeon]|nr:response regulator [Candidatus Thermoplasmatota archaeon]
MRVLVAEDDPISRHMLERTIRYWGHEVIPVPDGAMAWMFLNLRDLPDIALLDWEMPKIEGIDLCERIRGNPEMKDLYTIMLTSKGTDEDMLQGYQHGADDYVSKPISADDLKERLDRAVSIVGQHIGIDKRREVRFQNMKDFMGRKKASSGSPLPDGAS